MVNESKLIEFAGIATHSLVLEPLAALEELSKRGILYSDCVYAFADPVTVTTLDIAKATLGMATAMHDMIFEYQNSDLSNKQQALLMRRFLPFSYHTYMKNRFKFSPTDMFFFIHTKAFPHVWLDLAQKLVKKWKGIVPPSYVMFYLKEYDEAEKRLKIAVDAIPSHMKKHQVPKYIAMYYEKAYKDSDTALENANAQVPKISKELGISISDAWYFKREYKHTETVLNNAKTLIHTLENNYKNDKGSKARPKVSSSDIMFHIKKNPRNTEAAIDETVNNASCNSKKHDVTFPKAKYYEKEYTNPENSLITDIENGKIKSKKHT